MKRIASLCAALLVLVATDAAMAQTVKINEAYSRGTAGDLDWVEVYNPLSTPVDISGYKIYDSGGQAGTKPKKEFPAGTILPAKGFYAIIVDTASFTDDKSGFGISSGGETVWLENAGGTLIDTIAIPALGVDTAWGRIPDGADHWGRISPRTKAATNVFIKMNEVYSRGTPGNLDWVEIHNGSVASIDISGYKIYDSGGKSGSKSKKAFPAGTVLLPNTFYVIIVDTASFDGDDSGFGISSGGETLWLENAAGTLIDTVAVAAMPADSSWSRVPDGSNMFMMRAITRGATNGTATSVERPAAGTTFVLHQNYPNPFNPTTTLSYTLAVRGSVALTVHDLLGREVVRLVDGDMPAGTYTRVFDAGTLASGTYLLALRMGGTVTMRAMTLVR